MNTNTLKKIFPEPINHNYNELKIDLEGLWSITHPKDANIISKTLLICYFCKMLFNCCITFYSKQEPEKNESNLWLSYIIQTTLFVLLVTMIAKIENDFNSAMLMANNVFFCFGDLAFRITVDCKNGNRVLPYFG